MYDMRCIKTQEKITAPEHIKPAQFEKIRMGESH